MRRRLSYANRYGIANPNDDSDGNSHSYGHFDSDRNSYIHDHSNAETDPNTQVSTHTKGSAHSSTAALRMKRSVSRQPRKIAVGQPFQ